VNEARNEFIRATFTLSKSDPAAWENFLVAFNALTVEELELSTGSAVDATTIAVVMGMNRRMVTLRNDFRTIQALMEKIKR
jgi:uncharacterized membrane protein YadS